MQIKIIKYLNRPFPYQIEPKYKWFDTFGIGFLIAILLLIFQPFGIEILTIKYKNLLLSVFGIIYAVVIFCITPFRQKYLRVTNGQLKTK